MGVKVKLSKTSHQLIKNYLNICHPEFSSLKSSSSPMDSDQVIAWLASDIAIPATVSKKNKEKIEFILASLRAELLRDLLLSMEGSISPSKESDKKPSLLNKFKFVLLAISGTLLVACEGFDGITSLMSVLSIPSIAILAVGIVFSALSVAVFYGYDLVQISQNLGVKLRDAPKLLDVYLLQMDEIKAIRRTIETYNLAKLSADELAHYELTIVMLQKRLKTVTEASKRFELALDSKDMQTAETVFAGVAGLLFFGSGYFAGQSVAMFVLGLFISTVVPTFWPVILFSLVIGLAAFCLYWNVERVGLKTLISSWFGLDEEKVNKLCDSDNLVKEERKLTHLLEHVITTKELTSQLSVLKSSSFKFN